MGNRFFMGGKNDEKLQLTGSLRFVLVFRFGSIFECHVSVRKIKPSCLTVRLLHNHNAPSKIFGVLSRRFFFACVGPTKCRRLPNGEAHIFCFIEHTQLW